MDNDYHYVIKWLVGCERPTNPKWLLLNQPVGKSFLMKPNVWLFKMVVFCSWFTTILCVCDGGKAQVHSSGLSFAQPLFSASKLLASSQCQSHVVDYPESSLVNSYTTDPIASPSIRLTELASDNEDQTCASQSKDNDRESACLKLCLRAAERRLSRPDKQRVNSFINSKAKPPP